MLFGMNVANFLLEQLQKFRFPGVSPIPTTTIARTTRFLNACMANLTPLSISSPLDQKTKNIQRSQDSYETKVKKRGFKPDYDHKHEFGSEYRDTRATLPSAVHEDYEGKKPLRYPATLLPFLVHSSDQEEDADDEGGTESDLETHAGDDDLSYAANPEEDDEGYDSMRSRFKNVRIRKRQRDDTEDAVDDNIEGRQGAGPSHPNGDGQQKVLSLPLTEEERARRGKRSRRLPTISAADGDQAAHGTRET